MFRTLRRRAYAFCLLFLCALTIPVAATPQASCEGATCSKADAEGGKTVRVGYTQFAPYSGTSNTGVAEGYMIDLARLLLEPMDYTIRFIPHQNPSQLLESLEAGRIDVTTPLSFNPEREAFGAFTDSVYTFSFGVFVARSDSSITKAHELAGLRVGVSQGSQADRLLNSIEGAIAVPLDSGDELLLPLLSGDVDAVAAPASSLNYNIGRAGLSGRVQQTQFSLKESQAGFLVDRSQARLLQDLNAAIGLALNRGHIEDLYSRWFESGSDPLTHRERSVVVLSGGVVFLALLYWGWLHYGVRMRAHLATERANSLQEVLNATGETLMIMDSQMRPIWWNDAFSDNFPHQVPLLERGSNLKEILASIQQANTNDAFCAPESLNRSPDDQVLDLLAGREAQSVDLVEGGKVFKSQGVRLSSGQYGILATDVTALSIANAKLKSNTERLQQANRNLSEFSHVAAHDLAGPLRNIRSLHRWILEDIADTGVELEGEVLENFEHIDRLIERQGALIDDLLAYSASDQEASSRAFDPTTRWASVLDLCDIPKGFKVTTPSSMPHLFADPIGYDIVIRNLISNSAKHHDREFGKIDITYSLDGDDVKIHIMDDGPGIENAHISTIFQPFKTLKSRDRGGGTGLGLAFVERTVGKWGGQVNVSSDPANRVTTFSFTVPVAQNKSVAKNIIRLRAV